MDAYMIKKEDGNIHHFRSEVGDRWVSITEGVFYVYLQKYSLGTGDHQSAIKKHEEMVAERLAEGFYATPYAAIPENTVDTYDKAKWHFDGNFPADLEHSQAYVHTGLFLGWLIDHDMMSEEFLEDMTDEFEAFKNREITGPQIFMQMDGVLSLNDLNEAGNRFALPYFNFDRDAYLSDYDRVLATELPSIYHVKDTWENYDKLKVILDKRYEYSKSIDTSFTWWKAE
jgi:hypothetical protein